MSEKLSPKDRFDYAMRHFAMVADQRLKTFNFYLIACAAAVSASLALGSKTGVPRVTYCVIGSAHVAIAVVFFLIDWRGCRILRIATDSLRSLEREFLAGINEQQICEDQRRNKSNLWHIVSYRSAFRIVFAAQAVFGILFAWRQSALFG